VTPVEIHTVEWFGKTERNVRVLQGYLVYKKTQLQKILRIQTQECWNTYLKTRGFYKCGRFIGVCRRRKEASRIRNCYGGRNAPKSGGQYVSKSEDVIQSDDISCSKMKSVMR
jgi:hypothetical protein